MTKKRRKRGSANAGAAALTAVLPEDIQVIPVPAGAIVTVEVDVNDMTIPYTIALDGEVIIKALVDRRKELPPLTLGARRLGWGFAHTEKNWKHKVTVTIDGAATVLESRSEEKKDPDHSVGVAFLSVE